MMRKSRVKKERTHYYRNDKFGKTRQSQGREFHWFEKVYTSVALPEEVRRFANWDDESEKDPPNIYDMLE